MKKLCSKFTKTKFIPCNVMINRLLSEREFIENYKILYKYKLSSANLNILIFEVKLTFQSVKQAHDNNKKVDIMNSTLGSKSLFQLITVLCIIILQITNSFVHRMFPDSLWFINVLHVCASAPISSGTASHQGTLSHFYPLCMQKHYRNKCVLHLSGTGSFILQTETGFKIQISIRETLLEQGRYLIKLNNIYISTYFKVSKVMLYSRLFDIWVNSPLNPTGSQMDQYIPDRCRVDTSLPAHSRPGTRATYSAQKAYREYPCGRDLHWRRWTRFLT